MSSQGISYELALRLKNAGFPQGLTDHQWGWVEAHNSFEMDEGDMTLGVSSPTLGELIEACGEGFKNLERDVSTPKVLWVCNNYRDLEEEPKEDWTEGSTPSEAVANLWLALNKKDGND